MSNYQILCGDALELLRDLGAKARDSWERGRTVNADRVVEECETALEQIAAVAAPRPDQQGIN